MGYSNSGGPFNELVNGVHYDKNARKTAWACQMLKNKTDAIDLYWQVKIGKDEQKKP